MWLQEDFQFIATVTFACLVLSAIIAFPFRKKSPHFLAAWSSLQAWLFAAPIFFFLVGASFQTALAGFYILALFALKEFFQMTGMYHRSSFVWISYIGLAALSWCVWKDHHELYNLLPMIFLGAISLVPILWGESDRMVQYLGLSLLGFIFIGWAYLHIGWLLKEPNGPLLIIFVTILSEWADNVSLAVTRLIGKTKIMDKIASRRTLEGFLAASVTTPLVGWSLRFLLKDQAEYWLVLSLIALFVGGLGDILLGIIRRDLGVRDTGAFILGRSGILDRLDRLIFVVPITYFYLQHAEELLLLFK